MAKSRLHFVLVQDRTGLTNEELAGFRSELVEVIQRYFEIDEQGFDIDYERMGETTTLVINSPVVVKRQESINGVAGARHEKKMVANGHEPASRESSNGHARRSGKRRSRAQRKKRAAQE